MHYVKINVGSFIIQLQNACGFIIVCYSLEHPLAKLHLNQNQHYEIPCLKDYGLIEQFLLLFRKGQLDSYALAQMMAEIS